MPKKELLELIEAAGLADKLLELKTKFKQGAINENELSKEMDKLIDEVKENHLDQYQKYSKNLNQKPLIIGNGDITSLSEARQKAEQYGLDGIMIGRGVFHNPWIFNPEIVETKEGLLNTKTGKLITKQDRIELLLQHVRLFEETWGDAKHFAILKRFFKIYIIGFKGAASLRAELMETNYYQEVYKLFV